MERVEGILLNAVQTSFPVATRPYRVLGELAGISEPEAWDRMRQLRAEGIIRRLGGVFDSHRLGYHSTLCAAKVPEEKVSCLAGLLEKISGVTHNYLRTHAYNMWFTLIAASQGQVEATLARLRADSGIQEIYSLPATRLFKIKVDFDVMEQKKSARRRSLADLPPSKVQGYDPAMVTVKTLTAEEIALVKLLQEDLPEGLTPYAEIAERLGQREAVVLQAIEGMLRDGVMRRLGAVLRHQKAGFTANAMGVWQAPDERAAEVGAIMSRFKEISHCYQRPILPDWPYNLFSMIHGHSQEECRQVMEEVAQVTGVDRYDMLFSTVELKKSSMRYFVD